MRRKVRVVRSRTDSIMGSNHRIFQNVAVRDLRHNSNHFMVVEIMRGASPREHYHYLGSRTRVLLHTPGRQKRIRQKKLFAELQRAVPKPDQGSARHNLWISAETWILLDERVSTSREPGQYQRRLR